MKYFISGGSRGLGAQLVGKLAADGHDVAFTYHSNRQAAEAVRARAAEAGCRVLAQQMDAGDSASVEAAAQSALEALDGMDVVVNSAGVNQPGLSAMLEDDAWLSVVQTNLTGSFFVSRAFLMPFLAQGYGRFIHMGSISATGMAGQAAYSASKAGLEGLSASLAKEYGAKGIRSNVLRLGLADTDMSRETAHADLAARWQAHCPAGRLMTAEDIYGAVSFLSGEGSDFINGSVLPVTGGLEQVV